MKHLYTVVCVGLLSLICCSTIGYSQTDTAKILPPLPVKQNAGFDVIIKKNGDIVYGLVTEVAPLLVFYKRTDIPDGPIYSIPRNEVYAISYRNQIVDYLQPVDGNGVLLPNTGNPYDRYPKINYDKNLLMQNAAVHVGLGFVRSFSKVKNANDYAASGGTPVISLGYDVTLGTRKRDKNNPYAPVVTSTTKNNVKVGLLVGFGSHRLSSDDISTYDSTLNSTTLKENIFGLYVYGKYKVANSTSRLQPYVTLGLGIATSHVTSENRISFINDDSKELLVKSGARGASLNLMARVGAEYYFTNQLQAFLEAGSGLSVLNLGVSVSVK